jgi:hypothetical protein
VEQAIPNPPLFMAGFVLLGGATVCIRPKSKSIAEFPLAEIPLAALPSMLLSEILARDARSTRMPSRPLFLIVAPMMRALELCKTCMPSSVLFWMVLGSPKAVGTCHPIRADEFSSTAIPVRLFSTVLLMMEAELSGQTRMPFCWKPRSGDQNLARPLKAGNRRWRMIPSRSDG